MKTVQKVQKITIDELSQTARELQRIAELIESGEIEQQSADAIINAHGKFIKAFAEQTKWELLHEHAQTILNDARRVTQITDTQSTNHSS